MIKFVFAFLICLPLLCIASNAQSIIQQPQAIDSFNLSLIQNVGSCSYRVVISTSCSSPRYTRDQISLAFGDAYGNQIYAPRIDDPSTKAFERCSTDTFTISGPCAYQICYVYLYRTGPDGWKPTTVKISGYNSYPVTFTYNVFIPSGTWYGFNFCQTASSANMAPIQGFSMYAILALVLNFAF